MARNYYRLFKRMDMIQRLIYNFKKVTIHISEARKSGIPPVQLFIYIIFKIFKRIFKVDRIEQHLASVALIKQAGMDKDFSQTETEIPVDNILDSNSYEVTGKQNANYINKHLSKIKNKRFIWFIPNCANVWGGGHYTIFRFANHFANAYNTENIIFIYDYVPGEHAPLDKFEKELKKALPNYKLKVEVDMASLPPCHVALATTWQSAYFVKNFDLCQQKFYFMQDYESLFYPAGSRALQANYTYNFGFYGITGGLWLKSIFESYGGEAQEYIFSTDQDIFYSKDDLEVKEVKKVFFYGRPSTERRAYELGIAVLALIAKDFPHIEIVIAGLDGLYKPPFKCKLLGNLSLKATGELYRSCDIGIAFSATNLSYLPVELMASGCVVLTNAGPQVEWYCKNNYNCITANPTPSEIFQSFKTLLNSPELRRKIIRNGLKTAQKTSWEKEMNKIYQYISSKI
jgi:glycosyltransferase involved in cell wall biosynthesis